MARDLGALERVIGTILRSGVALSALAMIAGLTLVASGQASGRAVLNAGLILLMMIPTARILASLVDAILRRDRLLAVSTAIVTGVIIWQVIVKIF